MIYFGSVVFKILSSIYAPDFEGAFSKNFEQKVAFDKIDPEHTSELQNANYEALTKLAISHSDGLIMASEALPQTVVNHIRESKKPQLDFADSKNEEVYIEFYSEKL